MDAKELKEMRKWDALLSKTGRRSLPANKRYHVFFDGGGIGIHCSSLDVADGEPDTLFLRDRTGKIITFIRRSSVKSIDVCKDNFWTVIGNIYTRDD